MNWPCCQQGTPYPIFVPGGSFTFFNLKFWLIKLEINTRWSLRTIFFQNCSTLEPLHPKLNLPKHVFGRPQRGILATWHRHYPWLHYLQEEDLVLHFYYAYHTHIKKKFTEAGFKKLTVGPVQIHPAEAKSTCH